MKEFVCINCPLGCRLSVDDSDKDNIKVSGNTCNRGKAYAIDEVTTPKRMVTSTVWVTNGQEKMLSVKTSRPIPKQHIFDAVFKLKSVKAVAPIQIGDVVLADVYGADFVATKQILKAEENLKQ